MPEARNGDEIEHHHDGDEAQEGQGMATEALASHLEPQTLPALEEQSAQSPLAVSARLAGPDFIEHPRDQAE